MASFSDLSSIPGDVKKGAQAIYDVVMKEGQAEGMDEVRRLPLGKDGSSRWEIKLVIYGHPATAWISSRERASQDVERDKPRNKGDDHI